MKTQPKFAALMLLAGVASFSVYAQEGQQDDQVQDMSDPLAVYTQGGLGITDKGFNIKVGQAYDSGKANTMAMNVMEMKGVGGDLLGIRDNDEALYQNVDDSIDSFRLRNFQVNTKNGLGKQLDVSYNVDNETLDASYSLMQALPKLGFVTFYPLAGVGVTAKNDLDGGDGYDIPGTFTVVGMYSKIEITDKIWLNYNPMYLHTLSGSNDYKDEYYAGQNNILTHEFAASYQINKRLNVRYFANWNEHVSFGDGDHRIEVNYQF